MGIKTLSILTSLVVVSLSLWRIAQSDKRFRSESLPARVAARGKQVPMSLVAREFPMRIAGRLGSEDIVSDEVLLKALNASLPWWDPAPVASLLHELKLWGPNARFKRPGEDQEVSGRSILDTLLSDKLCRQRTPLGASYLLDSPYGIHVVLSGSADAVEDRAEGHYGQLLSVLAEAGIPLDSQVIASSGRVGTIADILQDAILRFSLSHELEFMSVALALWLPPEREWSDQFGNSHSFDQLMEHLVLSPPGRGACGGTHAAYANAILLRVDEEYDILSTDSRNRGLEYLRNVSWLLTRNELPEGGWNNTWHGMSPVDQMWGDSQMDTITIVGHHLEWMAIAPADAVPKQEVIARAVVALEIQLDSLPPLHYRPFKAILPCSHAARALCLMKRQDAYPAWQRFWNSGLLVRSEMGFELKN